MGKNDCVQVNKRNKNSRIFCYDNKRGKVVALVPFADMLNHYQPRETTWDYSDIDQGFQIKSLKNINPGEQIFDSYGKKSNLRYLLNYGFTVENNTESGRCPNEVLLHIKLPETDPNYSRKVNRRVTLDKFIVQVWFGR